MRLSRDMYTIEGKDGFIELIPMPVRVRKSFDPVSTDRPSTDPVSMDGASMDVRSFGHIFNGLQNQRTRRRKHHHKKYMRLYLHRFDSWEAFLRWLESWINRRTI